MEIMKREKGTKKTKKNLLQNTKYLNTLKTWVDSWQYCEND